MIPSGKILVVLLLSFLLLQLVAAQQFKYAAELNKVDTSGFYEIIITPQISRYLKPDFSDIRIADENSRWVPHILQQGEAIVLDTLFRSLPLLQNRVNDSGKNLLIVENTKTSGINHLKLLLKNAAVSRLASLSGSNNQQDWYIIVDNISINRSNETFKDEYMQEINFPLVKYRYLKLVIDNAHNEPLLISGAGFYTKPSNKKTIAYHVNPPPFSTQKDSNNYSYIVVKQPDNYQFDKISISTIGPLYYSRSVQIRLPEFDKKNVPMPGRIIGNFKLISGTTCLFYLTRTKTPLFYIVIKNGDSPPLQIEAIRTALQDAALVSYLEKDKKYKLLLGDSLTSFADYDLQSFKDSITVKRMLKYGAVHAIPKETLNKKNRNSNWWIWPAIILAGVVLSFLTYRLTVDINKPVK